MTRVDTSYPYQTSRAPVRRLVAMPGARREVGPPRSAAGAGSAVLRSLGRAAPRTALFVFACATLGFVVPSEAAPIRVEVRGSAKLTAHASRERAAPPSPDGAEARPGPRVTEVVLSGALVDDVGVPLARQIVTAHVERLDEPGGRAVAVSLDDARACDVGALRAADAAGAVAVTTDDDGRFCLRARLDAARYVARLAFAPGRGEAFMDGAERLVPFDLGRRGLTLRFDPAPRLLRVDAAETPITVVAAVDEGDGPAVAPRLPLVLSNEREVLGRATTDAAGRATFALGGRELGPPGRGELRVSFAGDDATAPGEEGQEIERRARVSLEVPEADRGALPAVDPEEGVPLIVEVRTHLGDVGEGSVEARIDDIVVGAAPVEAGRARLMATFRAGGAEALLKLRYLPASPWYEPTPEIALRVPIRPPSLGSKVPIVLMGLAVLVLFLLGRASGKRAHERAMRSAPARSEPGAPRLEVVRAPGGGRRRWRGRVRDAHDDVPVPRARVWIERGTFEGREVLASVEADEGGAFDLEVPFEVHGDERFSAEAPLHARLTQPLPPPGELSVSLAQRRRALLSALVGWARRRGAPYDASPEPTPGHVRQAAANEATTARWAEAVERAAFGPGDVDADRERDVERLAPRASVGEAPRERVE